MMVVNSSSALATTSSAALSKKHSASVEIVHAAVARLMSQASAKAHMKTDISLVVQLHPLGFRCAWLAIVMLHCVCAVFLTQVARVYWFLTHPRMEYWAKLTVEDRYVYLRHASGVYGLLAALHYYQLLRILWATLRARELAFPDSSSSIWNAISRSSTVQSSKSSHDTSSRLPSIPASSRCQQLRQLPHTLKRIWWFFFSRRGVLGVESDVFRVVFVVRETIEIVSQTFQTKRSSELLPRPWLNNLLVALVVTNCWSTPILQRAFRHHEGKERIACLLLDALLNMGSSMAVPIAVFWPYYKQLDRDSFLFPAASMYDGVWWSKFTMETQLLFSLSTANALSKLVSHLGIFASAANAATLVRRRRNHRSGTVFTIGSASRSTYTHVKVNRVGMWQVDTRPATRPLSTQTTASTAHNKSVATRCKLAVHTLFCVWGLGVLALHLHALTRLRSDVPGCRQSINAWFASGYPCTVYNYNCYRQGVTSPSEESWTHLDTQSLLFLAVSHCSELRMPRSFQRFGRLGTLNLHNVTVVEWSRESAISATKHSELSMLLIEHFNATGLPDGLLEPLPPKLIDIEFSHTNITALPADLHTRWHALTVLYLEHSLLTEFPTTLLSLPFAKLSLHGNRIEKLQELSEKSWRVLSFAMNANPIKELPDTVMSDTALQFLSLEGSHVTDLPVWVKTNVKRAVYLHGTPYCAKQVNDIRNGALVACVKRDDRVAGKVPVAILDELYPV